MSQIHFLESRRRLSLLWPSTGPYLSVPFRHLAEESNQKAAAANSEPAFRKTVFAQCVLQSDPQRGPHIAEAIELQSSVSAIQAFAFAFAFASRRQAERTASQNFIRPFHAWKLLQEQPDGAFLSFRSGNLLRSRGGARRQNGQRASW